MAKRKYAFIVPDGAADHPVPSLGGKTPLEAARAPNLARLAREGTLGLARTIPEGMPPGSDVGMLSLLGYDPRRYFTGGRAPIEAAALGIRLGPEDVAFRLNLVTVADGRMKDYSGGHISTGAARPIVEAIAKELGGGDWSFHPGVEYRHIFRWNRYGAATPLPKTTPPHEITDQPVAPNLPQGQHADRLLDVMERTRAIVPRFGTKATQGWIWSGGRAPSLPTLAERFGGARGAATSSVDIVRGLATLAGIAVVPVPGQTGLWDTDFPSEGRTAVNALFGEDDFDFAFIHIEGSDEATHSGLLDQKVRVIEQIDEHIVGPLLERARAGADLRILVSPDHATTIATRGHAADPVPFLLWGPGIAARGGEGYFEEAARVAMAGEPPVPGHELLARLFAA
ncbi:MAG TPA: 2,3-bisphosphoglycerate-independent phosphoglycerate mutase [Planctomycetota bacterium]|nr:2,3-bisphosphoglycerate-independent phosphoglycerate mutase [Planctomycetota bacterium]